MRYGDYEYRDISDLVGEVIYNVKENRCGSIDFHTVSGRSFRMLHLQDCCEEVWIEDITGDLDDLIGQEVVEAREDNKSNDNYSKYESTTWTFYTIRTNNTTVTIRWCGISNGHYSERADFVELKNKD